MSYQGPYIVASPRIGGPIGNLSGNNLFRAPTYTYNAGSQSILDMFESLIELVQDAKIYHTDTPLRADVLKNLPLLALEVLNEQLTQK